MSTWGRLPCKSGICFGSRHAGDVGTRLTPPLRQVWDFIPDAELRTVVNREAFAGTLVFDQWTCNGDGRQTVFVRQPDDRRFRVHVIDNGFCFGGAEWRLDDAPLRGLHRQTAAYDFILSFDIFEPWLYRIEKEIDLVSLETAASLIPPEWNRYGRQQLDRLLYTLDRRRHRVRDLIWQTIKAAPAAFRNFKFGPLAKARSTRENSQHGATRKRQYLESNGML